jgi:heme/copper-type cytochrome/quinol oxidase subunit 3
MSQAAVGHASHGQVTWPLDGQYGRATPGKIAMWIFLLSDAFGFMGFLLADGLFRAESSTWRAAGEPELGVTFTALLTALLIVTSATNVLGFWAAVRGRRSLAAVLLWVTVLGGLLFLLGQYSEWFGLRGPGLVQEGLVFGHSARASIFYVTTGYHGLHVLAGVIYMSIVTGGYMLRRADAGHIEVMSLFWCFVDFVWIFVFTFLYLLP